jgi:type 1 glutamine amidotransferase
MNKVLLVTDGLFHPPFWGRRYLRKFLTRKSGHQIQYVQTLDQFAEMNDQFAALILYFHHKKISDQTINVFDEFIKSGGGVLAIHSATASAKDNHAFTDILGGKFIGHGPVETFTVTPVVPEGAMFKQIGEFRVTDELYIHELQPDIETHFTTIYAGKSVPVVWTRNHGEGRVCYACPGHKTVTLQNKTYQRLLLQSLEWVIKA